MQETEARSWRPYLSLIASTSIAFVLTAILLAVVLAPFVPSDCFEWCDLDRLLATAAISLVWLIWLFVALTISWRWRMREPALAGLGALSCAAALLLVMALLVSWRSFDTTGGNYWTLVQLAQVVSLGLQLPPAWRLAARTRPLLAGPIAAGVMTAAAFVAVLAFFLGTHPIFSLGPQVHIWADFALAAALPILGVSRWLAGEDRSQMAVLIAAALFNVWVVGFSMLFPGSLAEIFVLRFLLLGLAWFTIGIAWLRQGTAAPATPESSPA